MSVEQMAEAAASLERATEALGHAFAAWDETVAAEHMAWITVRRAEKRVRDAQRNLQRVLAEVEKVSA